MNFLFQKHGTTQKPTKPLTLALEDQQKIAKVGLEMKLLTAEVEAEAEKWDLYSENNVCLNTFKDGKLFGAEAVFKFSNS